MCAKIVFSQNCRDAKNEVFEKKIAFFNMLLQEKNTKWKRPDNPIKIVF